jgi:hypothetical protein
MASTLQSGPGVFAPLAVVLHLRYGLSAAGHGLAKDLRTGGRRVVHLFEMAPILGQPKTFERHALHSRVDANSTIIFDGEPSNDVHS